MDNSGGAAAIYASFISAVTAAFSLQMVRQNNAIPLGPRTLFNTLKSKPNGLQDAAKNDHLPVLTSFQVQLTSTGKLTVALQTIPQAGLARLTQPEAVLSEIPSGTDLWLAPTGSIARLITSHSNPHSVSTTQEVGRWKSHVLEWLGYIGLALDPVTDKGWVEVQVWEPFYSKLSGEAARQREDSPLPLKQILWPAFYCFKRTNSSQLEPFTDEGSHSLHDPLDFAEEWWFREIPKATETGGGIPSDGHEQQTGLQTTSSPGFFLPSEGMESLSHPSLHPDVQSASLVYPTPPDGTAGIAASSVVSTTTKTDSDMAMGPSSGLGVGSGFYDTNEDDDLFGDINEKDFGTQGITDADFSFFDDQEFDLPSKGTIAGDIPGSPELAEAARPGAIFEFSEPSAPSPSSAPIIENYMPSKSPAEIPTTFQQELSISENNGVLLSPDHDKLQTISPPLSPIEVKKILFSESNPSTQTLDKSTHAPSHYSPVAFKNNTSSWDRKYGSDGKFAFMEAGSSLPQGPQIPSDGIPTIGLPRRKKNARTLAQHKAPVGHEGSPNEVESLSSPDSGSETDEESEVSQPAMPSVILPTLKRKRARSSPINSPGPSSEKALAGLEQEKSSPQSEDSIFLGNFLSTFSDCSIAGFFTLPETQLLPSLAPRESQVQLAQLLVDQVTQSSLNHKVDGNTEASCLEHQVLSVQELLDGPEYLGGFEKLDLNSFVSLQEQQSLLSPDASGGLTLRQNPQQKDTAKGTITKLSPPHLRVRRGKSFLETLPPAVFFWETFGLEPLHGPKDVAAYCIHPQFAARAADVFLERLALIYPSCSLGSHARGENLGAFRNGLVDWDVRLAKRSGYDSAMQQLKTICEELGESILPSY